MSALTDYAADLDALAGAELREYLGAHSGLPGPRANLTLADAFAAQASPDAIVAFSRDPDEYLAFCGTEALGMLVLDPERRDFALGALLAAAIDPRWRIREGVARALQIVGDADPSLLHSVIEEWLRSSDPFVLRAAISAICEPRLLGSPEAQELAVRACARATAWLLQSYPGTSRDGRKSLRQALGYCWSVAIAASPAQGIGPFNVIAADGSRDAQWIVRTNLTKARMRRAIAAHDLSVAVPKADS
jgi:hypothetical protein